jgi:hypothetical protein
VEAVNLLVDAETDNAPRGEGLCEVRLAGAGNPDEQDGGRLAHDVWLIHASAAAAREANKTSSTGFR